MRSSWDPQTERDARTEEKHQAQIQANIQTLIQDTSRLSSTQLDRCYHRLAISMLPSDRTFQTHYCSIVNIQQTRSYSTLIYSWESQKEVTHTLQGSQLPLKHVQELNKDMARGLKPGHCFRRQISASIVHASMFSFKENDLT